jgi:hypothetical protein
MYIPDVTSPEWLKRNYRDFEDKGQYVVSMFTLYKTPAACKANQVAWGYGTGEHLKACNEIGYRLRQASINTHLKTATLIMAAMIGHDGQIRPDSIEHEAITRTWADLDANTRTALERATALVLQQMRAYDLKMKDLH